FLSYARDDDRASRGRILRLAEMIADEYESLTATKLKIFVDREDILWGQAWEERIDNALQETTFFIPVLTPRYFNSDPCRKEFLDFYNAATDLG
uniref:toll/interleukin-1 receptor domain-containing protein n=1 Tax=Pseudomonas viridiflava TaxID=33069 RepID=UPI0013E05CCC